MTNQFMIILEGPDGGGKSTLASTLSEVLNRPIYHPGGPAQSVDDFRVRITAQERQELAIHDRHMAISEPVYANALGRPLAFEVSKHADYYLKHIEFRMYVIYCRHSSINHMFDSIDRTDKPHKTEEHIRQMRQRYIDIVDIYDERMLELAKATEYPNVIPIVYNYAVHDIADILSNIKELHS